MRLTGILLASLLVALTLCPAGAGALVAAPAQPDPLQSLVELLESKGVLSPAEAKALRAAAQASAQRLEAKERQLKAREKALRKKEKALAGHKTIPAPPAPPAPASAAKLPPVSASFDKGLVLRSDPPELFSLRLGSFLQSDFRSFHYDDHGVAKDKFDLRRVRLWMSGDIYERFHYKFEYEFQGSGSRRLLDAYVDADLIAGLGLRLGQYKTPFGLEQSSKDKDILFAERSMIYYLTPGRDVGLSMLGHLWDQRLHYNLGIFNGDGPDDTSGGDEDSPMLVGRVVFSPFGEKGPAWARNLQVGASYAYANMDRGNVRLDVQTAGLTTFMEVTSSAKFHVIQEAGEVTRTGLELGWAAGPLLLMGEYTRLGWSDLATSEDRFDLSVEGWYLAGLWMITGERPSFSGGLLLPLEPLRPLSKGGWGALGLALRYDWLEAGDELYTYLAEPGESVQRASAWSLGLHWILEDSVRLILDYTHTSFDRALLVGRDALTGHLMTSDYEDLVTARFQFGF